MNPTSVEVVQSAPLLLRHHSNPILTSDHWPYPINSVFNAGATLLEDGTTLLLCRVEDRAAYRIFALRAPLMASADGRSIPNPR